MKKLSRYRREDFSLVRLYLDDFYEIIESLKSECESVTIQADSYLLEDPKEVETLDKPIVRELNIRTSKPSLEVDLRPAIAWLHIYDDDTKALGLSKKIEDILTKSQSPIRFFINGWACVIFAFICGGAVFVPISYVLKQKPVTYPYLILACLILGFVLAVALPIVTLYFMDTRRQSLFLLERKSNRQGFLTRKKDELIIVIISAIVGSILTVVTMRFLGK